MEYLLHIGTNKTGTSSLQRLFFDNRDVLAEHGIAYPTVGVETAAHHNVSRALRGVDVAKLGMQDDWIEQLRAECQPSELCLLSSENFHTIQDPSVVLQLCPRGKTRVIVYIREHAAYLVSWYQQAVQSRNTAMTLDEFIEHHSADQMQMISGWVKAYGKENVIVRLYERPALKDGDVVADFCQYLAPDLSRKFKNSEMGMNPSIAGNLLFIKRALNVFISNQESLSIANEVAGLTNLDPTFRGKIPVPEKTIRRIKFLWSKDRATLNEMFDLGLKARNKPIEGAPFPDYSRLADDFQKIYKRATKKNFKLVGYLDRMSSMMTAVSK